MDKKAKKDSPLQAHLKNVFQMEDTSVDLPADMKKQVFDSLDWLNLIGDVADLFTVKFTKSEAILFDAIDSDDDGEED